MGHIVEIGYRFLAGGGIEKIELYVLYVAGN